ncbi:FGGY family of carbohydrate kinase [Klebsormidium nitens]|uniref:FGGY carbohydrate kinase domain-containing protein n=1 Tax=Klebsormidium nitens TaxID=105231 RepID=A0A1Y1IPP6_KLENI|nr:FGGY family of carbohydrate kinase [Klebsormidium nitens]|eukprot:GAQ91191.1 FGGY family of carbohydrate kinase [Klebsormidium nitens]
MAYYVGVDVGTGSARAGVFSQEGRMVGTSSKEIAIWKEGDFAEQSSANIWDSVCSAVKSAVREAGVDAASVKGLGFDATCSLVAVGELDAPVSVSRSGDDARDIIVWLDHRAVDQAQRINKKFDGQEALRYVGGHISPENEPPKLMWVKEKLPESWARAKGWFDLADWLSYKSTGDDTRSLCTIVCKWTYRGHAHVGASEREGPMPAAGWDKDFWRGIGLGDVVEEDFKRFGARVAFPGYPLGGGLTKQAAEDLGLPEGTPVGAGLIDAHAGGVGTMAGVPADVSSSDDVSAASVFARRLALVCGTSSCHMAVSDGSLFVPGVWGPFWSGMIPGLWLTEGGQSATGALLDHIFEGHSAYQALSERAKEAGCKVTELLNRRLEEMAAKEGAPFLAALTRDLHVLPDWHGNRAPQADPSSRGVICGLTLESGEDALARLYLAAVQGIAYGTRQIIEKMNASAHKVDTIIACGGLAKNSLFLKQHADITECPVILPRESEPVLLGAAIVGAVAARQFESIADAMQAMNSHGKIVLPVKAEIEKTYHAFKFSIFEDLYVSQVKYRKTMDSVLPT